MNRIQLLRIFLLLAGVSILFWWPLSHWFYPDWYHHLLGFKSYDPSLVKIIGTIGIFPVLGAFFSAKNPIRNKDLILILIVFCILMAGTYIYLITTMDFPILEYINVGILVCSAIVLTALFPYATPEGDTRISR